MQSARAGTHSVHAESWLQDVDGRCFDSRVLERTEFTCRPELQVSLAAMFCVFSLIIAFSCCSGPSLKSISVYGYY
jgi:hypothetical protein